MQNPEYQYEIALFQIRALSNLHAGSASENYGIIDNLVQRDPATDFPCINSSSIKGALREYCRNYLTGHDSARKEMITYIFGLDKKESDANEEGAGSSGGQGKNTAGAYRFLAADLLSIPVRGLEKPYFNATCPWLLKNLERELELFRKKLPTNWITGLLNASLSADALDFQFDRAEIDLDDVTLSLAAAPPHLDEAKAHLGDDIAILSNKLYQELVSDYRLPVIARNNLEDGRSTNLWYEQVLPRETRMAFFVLYPKDSESQPNHFTAFEQAITGFPVQIGANASVGYGFCEISTIQLQPV